MRKSFSNVIGIALVICMLTAMLTSLTAFANTDATSGAKDRTFIFRQTFTNDSINTSGSTANLDAAMGFGLLDSANCTYTLENETLKFTSRTGNGAYTDIRFNSTATAKDLTQDFILSFWIKPDTDDITIKKTGWAWYDTNDGGSSVAEKTIFYIEDGKFFIGGKSYDDAQLHKDVWSLVEIVFHYDETATSNSGKQGATTSYSFMLDGKVIGTASAPVKFNNINYFRILRYSDATYELDDLTVTLGSESLIDIPRTEKSDIIYSNDFPSANCMNTTNTEAAINAANGMWNKFANDTQVTFDGNIFNHLDSTSNDPYFELRYYYGDNLKNLKRDFTISFWMKPTSSNATFRFDIGTKSTLDSKAFAIVKNKVRINNDVYDNAVLALNEWSLIEIVAQYDAEKGGTYAYTVRLNGEVVDTVDALTVHTEMDRFVLFRKSSGTYSIDNFMITAGNTSVINTLNPYCAISDGDHTGGTATCKDKAVCSYCNQTYGELTGHTSNTDDCTYVCTVCGETVTEECTDPISFSGVYLNLNENINVVYTVKAHSCVNNPYMVFTLRGNEYTVNNYTKRDDGTLAFAFEKVMPYYMCEEISATLYATKDGQTVSVAQNGVSVKEYCNRAVALNATDSKFVALASDLLVYGAKSQIYTNYKTDALATDGVEWLAPTEFTVPETNFEFSGEMSDSYTWTGAGLNLTNEMNMYISFTAESVEGLSVMFTINDREYIYDVSEYTPDENGKYKVYFCGVNAYEFGDVVTVNFVVDEAIVGDTLSYSVNSYINHMYNNSNEALAELVKAISNYGKSAADYK